MSQHGPFWKNHLFRTFEKNIIFPWIFIYINDLSDDLSANASPFSDYTSLFSVVRDINTSVAHFNNDFRKISNWAFQWKMSFNPDPPNPKPFNPNPAHEVIFSTKLQNVTHPSLYFNNNPIEQVSSQKHLWMILDATLNFQEHIKNLLIKVLIKILGYCKSLKTSCPKDHYSQYLNCFSCLILITVIYDQNFNNTFHQKMASIQHNAALAITGALRGSSRENLYQKLGLESL